MTFLLVIIYFSFISLGLPDSLLGAVWPTMQPEFNVPIPFGGYVGMTTSFCTVLSSLMAQRFYKWFGTGKTIAISTVLTAIAIIGYSIVLTFWMFFPLAVVLGIGAGAIDSALNNYVALHYKARHMSFLHCCWGLGCTIGPLILSFCIQNSTWRTAYRIIALMQAILAIVQICTIQMWNGHDNAEGGKNSEGTFTASVSLRTKPLALLSFLCYCAYETSCILWISTFFVKVLGASEQIGATASSAFFIGITSGRFISGLISDRIGVKKMIYIGAFIALISSVVLFFSKNIPLSFVMAVLIGIGCGPIYPSMIHRTPRRYGSNNSPKIIGQQMATAYVGSTLFPMILGNIAMYLGFKIIPIVGIIFMLTLMIFTFIIESSSVQ